MMALILCSERDNLRLSDIQRSIFSGWTRPVRDNNNNLPRESSVLIPSNMDVNLVQDVTTDCSVVASLCVISSRASKGHGQVERNYLYYILSIH